MIRTASDSELLEAYKSGDDAAFRGIWERHAGALRRFLRAHFGPDIACEDLLQEAFLSLAQNAGSIRDPGVVRAYLMIAARRLGFIERRKIQRRGLVGLDAAGHIAGPAVDHEQRETLARVHDLLERLSPRRRAAFFAYCVQERTVDESAQELGVSPATIQRDVRAARRLAVRCVTSRTATRTGASRPLRA